MAAYYVGQLVECKDKKDESWQKGKVTSISPLKVQADGFVAGLSWDHVRAVQEAAYYVGQLVECKDKKDESWQKGKVSVPARPRVGDRVRLKAGAKKTTGVLAGGAIGIVEQEVLKPGCGTQMSVKALNGYKTDWYYDGDIEVVVAFTPDVFALKNPADGDAVYWFHSKQDDFKSDKAPGQQNLFLNDYTPGDVIFRSLVPEALPDLPEIVKAAASGPASQFNHTGLYVSSEEVYEWTGKGEIKRSTFEEFAKSKQVFIKGDHEAKVFPPAEVVGRAREAHDDPSFYHGNSLHGSDYNSLFQNCQHFTDWCKTGKKRSVESQRVKGGAIGGLGCAMAASTIQLARLLLLPQLLGCLLGSTSIASS
jgi:hypothetical protein